jgi:putative ABC transport system permease protein
MEKIDEYFRIALRNLRTRSLRSWLTILGIVIGVFLIISLLSLSEGIKDTINQQLRALGGEIIFIMPGEGYNPLMMMMSGEQLEREDIEAIKRTEGVDTVLSMSTGAVVMRYEGEGKSVFLSGQSWREGLEILQMFQGWSLAEGKWPTSGKREIIVGKEVAEGIFEEEIKINKEAVIKGRRFEIVGILNSLGSRMDDSSVYLDMDLYQSLTGEKKGSAQLAMAKIEEGALADEIAENIKESLDETRKRRVGTDTSDFSVITSEKIGDIANNILAVIQFAIIIFAGIAIVVGGIGITNTMFTAVMERTREIGIMKAIGAKNSAVLTIFLIEAGIIGFSGGVGGTLLGVVLAKIIEIYGQAHPAFYFSASISSGLVLFGLFFSFFVGCLAGFLPARRAASLKPVEALRRYE